MKFIVRIKVIIVAAAIIGVCRTADAKHRHLRYRPHRVTTVVVRPVVTSHVCNRLSMKERLAMAMAYLETHEYLTVSQYSQMASLTKNVAKAELNTFASDKRILMAAVVKGKKTVFIKKK